MSWLSRLMGRKSTEEVAPVAHVECPHVTLVPHWDSAADMGHEDRATSFRCDACGNTFTPAEARELRRTEADRLSHGTGT